MELQVARPDGDAAVEIGLSGLESALSAMEATLERLERLADRIEARLGVEAGEPPAVS